MFEISKTFEFAASHQLTGLPETHKCSRLHGHNYRVTVTLRSERLDSHSMVLDYAEMDIIKRYLDDTLDHRHLNDVFSTADTTAENLAFILYRAFSGLVPFLYKVTVSETDKTVASYWRENGV